MPDTTAMPNSPEALAPLVADGRIPMRRVWGMLAIRSAVPFGLLVLGAAAFALAGQDEAVAASAAWWLWYVTVANIVCIVLMNRFSRPEGMRLRDMFFAQRTTWRGDVLWVLAALVGTAAVAMLPGTLLAQALWGDPATPNAMLFQPITLCAVYPLFVLMPVTQAYAELPTYWGYVAPRVRASGMSRWLVIGIVGAVLSVQHMFLAFQLDWRYDLWLALKFLPFALLVGFIVDRRPTTLPYLMAVHLLLDAALPVLLWMAARGAVL